MMSWDDLSVCIGKYNAITPGVSAPEQMRVCTDLLSRVLDALGGSFTDVPGSHETAKLDFLVENVRDLSVIASDAITFNRQKLFQFDNPADITIADAPLVALKFEHKVAIIRASGILENHVRRSLECIGMKRIEETIDIE